MSFGAFVLLVMAALFGFLSGYHGSANIAARRSPRGQSDHAQHCSRRLQELLQDLFCLVQLSLPRWVTLFGAAAIALGTASGGWRLIRTLGYRVYRIRPVHGFDSRLSAAGVILCASLIGGPVSTTEVVGSAIVGAGASERLSKVHWHVAYDMALAWVLTIPVCGMLGALLLWLVEMWMLTRVGGG